jgi:hypothetical protein
MSEYTVETRSKTIISNTCPSGWETVKFYQVKGDNIANKMHDQTSLLTQLYGESEYPKTWWITHNSICMNEKIYVHWKLSN